MAKWPDFDPKDIVALKVILLSNNNNLWEKVVRRNYEKPFTFDNPVWKEINWLSDVDGLTWELTDQAVKLTAISWSNKRITGRLKLDGFNNLLAFFCYNNRIESLEIKNLTALAQLSCFGNSLTSLTLKNLPGLKELYCFSNRLDTLNVDGLTALEKLSCYKNQLTSLHCDALSRLAYLDCSSNNLSSLKIAGLDCLSYLDCSLNNLHILEIDNLINLAQLSCFSNKLTSLPVEKLTKLTYINCFFNNLTSLDVRHLPAITYLSCWGNQIAFGKLPRLSIDEFHYEYQRIHISGVKAGVRLNLSDLIIKGETTVYRYGNVINYLYPDGTFIVPADIRREGKLEIQMTNSAFPKFLENSLPLLLLLTE
jgi:Leucine-rich repeat (LRR) protein